MNNFVDILFKKYIERVYKEVLPLPDVQMKELRKCFFAAVWATLHETSAVAGERTEEEAEKVLASIHAECEREVQGVLDKWYEGN